MYKVANKITSLIYQPKAGFCKNVFLSGANPIKQRVMSTPTWPVPYYQRISKAYPIREESKPNLETGLLPSNDGNWLSAKLILNQTAKGRQIVSYTEQNIKTNTFLIRKDDCESMVKAYVNDISQFLDISNKQNVKILKGKTLI